MKHRTSLKKKNVHIPFILLTTKRHGKWRLKRTMSLARDSDANYILANIYD